MEVRKAHTIRLYPTKEQKAVIDQIFGACRYVYNYYLDMQISAYDSAGISVPYPQLSKDLVQLRKTTQWMTDLQFMPLQQSLRNLVMAYDNFFTKKANFPRHKTKRTKQSFKKTHGWSIKGNRVFIQRGLSVKYRGKTTACNKAKSIIISKTPAGKYYASITCFESLESPQLQNNIGVDLGLTDLAITSEGTKYERPRLVQANAKRLRKLQKDLNRKKKGSNNRDKARQLVARLHDRIANQRLDNLHKTSHAIVSGNYELIGVEDLSVANMMKNRRLSRSIGDTGWAELIRQIEYKQAWKGGRTIKIDRFFPSSKQCSNCSVVIAKLPLSVRHWQCGGCGVMHDRDVNAAINIRKQAEVLLGVEKEALVSSDTKLPSMKHGRLKSMPTL